MTTTATPPQLAEDILRMLLPPHDRDAVSGDLLEEYRESIHPARGQLGADLWYIGQVTGFFWRGNAVLILLLCVSMLGRTALDWFEPTTDFHARSTISTLIGVAILTAAAFVAAWRSRSPLAGMLAGVAIPVVAAPIAIAGTLVLLAFNHDPQAMAAIEGSGGLGEALTFPAILVIPGVLLGILGGLIGYSARKAA